MSPRIYPINCNRPLGDGDIILRIKPGKDTAYLNEPYRYRDPEGVVREIEKGLPTDLQSIPCMVRPFLPRDMGMAHFAIPHDDDYASKTPRAIADLRGYYTIVATKQDHLLACLYYYALRWNGWYAYHEFHKRFRPDAMLALCVTSALTLIPLVPLRLVMLVRDVAKAVKRRITSLWRPPCDAT